MQRSFIAPVIAFGELAGSAQKKIAGLSATDPIPWELPALVLLVSLVMLVVSLIVFVVLAGLLVLSGRGAQSEDEV